MLGGLCKWSYLRRRVLGLFDAGAGIAHLFLSSDIAKESTGDPPAERIPQNAIGLMYHRVYS